VPHDTLRAITDLADSGLILPLCALLAGVLWFVESRRSAWLFLRALLLCLIAMALLKIGFLSCGKAAGSAIHSPSGHASLATFFFGSLACVIFVRLTAPWRWVAPVATVVLVIAIGLTRVLLGAHSPAEVIIGSAVGGLSLAAFVLPYLKLPRRRLSLRPLLLALGPLFLLCYGSALPAEELLHAMIPHLQPTICSA